MIFSYLLIRAILWPISLLSYSAIHSLGNALGWALYHLYPKFRKRALSNLALASDLQLSNAEVKKIALGSCQNLMIVALEYGKLSREKHLSRLVQSDIIPAQGASIFFCGHQANWELFFLEGSRLMPGVAIGRPIKNHYLYNWILKIRQKYGGKIIVPKQAAKEGLRALREGKFLGIVGDQGMPGSGFHCPFLGRDAWTSPLPAILAYRTGAPLFLATMVRKKGKYLIHTEGPFCADPEKPAPEEIDRLMKTVLGAFEKSIILHPDQWLWQHNRWKQQSLDQLKKMYRQDAIAIILPPDLKLIKEAACFRQFYPSEFIACFVPQNHFITLAGVEMIPYNSPQELLREDFRFKLLYNFTGDRKVDRHYKKLSVFNSVHLEDLESGATLEERLKKTIAHAR